MVRQGVLLIVIAFAGFCGIALYNVAMSSTWTPFHAALPVTSSQYKTANFRLQSGQRYGLIIAVNPAREVPYADCLLGATGGLSGDCKGHPSALNLVWSIRDERGRIVASGIAPTKGLQMFGYSGNYADTTLDYFSVQRPTIATLDLHYRSNAGQLAPLHPTIEVTVRDNANPPGIAEFFLAFLLIAVGAFGAIILLGYTMSRYVPARRPT